MNLYIATSFLARADAAALAVRVRALDVRVVSSWHDAGVPGDDGAVPESELPHAVLETIAAGNHRDLNRADALALLVRPKMQGALVELGVALGAGKRVFLVGERTAVTPMARHHRVAWCADADTLLAAICEATGRRRPSGVT